MWHFGCSKLPRCLQIKIESGVHREMGVVAEEADESVLWLELLEETGTLTGERLQEISKEARELTAIFSSSLRTAKGRS